MDKKYIEENKLTEARKRFQQINEYILNMNGETSEAQDDNTQEPQPDMQGGQQPPMDNMQQQPMDGNQPQQQGMGQQPPMDANDGMPQQGANQQMPQDNTLDPTIGAEAGQDDNMPEPDENGIIEPEFPEEGDEVIDVDDLTQSQETTEYKLDGVDDKLNNLINIVSKFAEAIDDNDEKIEDLKREIAERNPSQQERLNIRSMSGSPYTVSPQDYWSEQNKNNPQYNVIADNDVDPDKEEDLYTITDDDIKNFNKSEIEKSINDIPMNLKDYFYESKNNKKHLKESYPWNEDRDEVLDNRTLSRLVMEHIKKKINDVIIPNLPQNENITVDDLFEELLDKACVDEGDRLDYDEVQALVYAFEDIQKEYGIKGDVFLFDDFEYGLPEEPSRDGFDSWSDFYRWRDGR